MFYDSLDEKGCCRRINNQRTEALPHVKRLRGAPSLQDLPRRSCKVFALLDFNVYDVDRGLASRHIGGSR